MPQPFSMSQILENIFLINSAQNIVENTISIVCGILIGLLIALTYRICNKGVKFSMEYAVSLVVVCAVIAMIISVIGTNIARAFSLAGALSIIRFRSLQQTPRDIAFIFFAMGAGLACGAGLYVPAFIFVVLLSIVMIAYSIIRDNNKKIVRLLKICVPENISFDRQFDEILDKYTSTYELQKVRLISAGTVVEIQYIVQMNDLESSKKLIDDVRTKNANFNVSFTLPIDEIKD